MTCFSENQRKYFLLNFSTNIYLYIFLPWKTIKESQMSKKKNNVQLNILKQMQQYILTSSKELVPDGPSSTVKA